jgi:hypothetical protein
MTAQCFTKISALVTVLLVITAATFPASAQPTSLDADGVLIVKGHRFFPIGIYECPEDDVALHDMAYAGFNLVRCSANRESLDRAASVGMKAWIPLGGNLAVRTDADRSRLADIIAAHKDHPALVAWEGPDEPLWNVWYSTSLWFQNEQPSLFRKHIDGFEGDKAERIRDVLNAYRASLQTADYAGAEGAASRLWSLLEMQSPHPDLLMTTAPKRAKDLADALLAGYELIRRMDPARPMWLNHAPRNTIAGLAYFNRAADIVGCDIYPVPEVPQNGHSDLANRRMSCVGDYTDRMKAAAPGKPVWMVLQGFGWHDLRETSNRPPETGRRPTYDETRFMAYDAIVHGAKGILYWGTHRVEKPSSFWTDLTRVVRELSQIHSVLAAPAEALSADVVIDPTLHSADKNIALLTKRVGTNVCLIVVNEFQAPLQFTISRLPLPDGTVFREITGGSTVTVENGGLCYGLDGYGTAVLMQQ